MRAPSIGVLALQGDVEPHARMLARAGAGCPVRLVRNRADLDQVTHLVLPGGESTTLARLLALFDLSRTLVARHRAGTLALFGTCAGTILLANELGLLDVDIERNAYGRQLDSFRAPLALSFVAAPRTIEGVFIRAPRITRIGASVRVLASHDGDPVLVEAPGVVAATFHPELTGDADVHARFLELPTTETAEKATA